MSYLLLVAPLDNWEFPILLFTHLIQLSDFHLAHAIYTIASCYNKINLIIFFDTISMFRK